MVIYKWLYYLKSYNISTLLWKMLQNVDILQGGTLGFGNVVHCPFQYFPCFQHSPWHLNNDEPALFVKANGSAACHFGDVGFASGLRFHLCFPFVQGTQQQTWFNIITTSMPVPHPFATLA